MLKAEKKSLVQFNALFLLLNIIFLFTTSILYFEYQKNLYLDLYEKSMSHYANKVIKTSYNAKNLDLLAKNILKDPRYEVVFIYQNDIIYATGNTKTIEFVDGFANFNSYLQYAEPIQMTHIKNIDYVVIKRSGLQQELSEIKKSILIYLFLALAFMMLGVILLSRLFLRPLRDYIMKLDTFIQDTTHELNTPLSVILMSIQRIDQDSLNQNNQKQIKRINIASKTISNLYNDLTFLVQYKTFQDNIEEFDIQDLIQERIIYFKELALSKNIIINENLESKILKIDKFKLTRVIDNLLSNAIKYNKKNGTIDIFLSDESLSVKDTGIGIDDDKIADVFTLYTRFDDANGGFGIGLNLVKMICDQYRFKIGVNSKLGVGTTFTIYFK